MICKKCRKAKHEKCKGGTWCDCQHRAKPFDPDVFWSAMQQIADNMLKSILGDIEWKP